MIKIGTSGFSFDDWKGTIYPPGLAKEKWLGFYEKELGFKTLEVNFTYYSLPSAKSFEGMSRKTSADFSFVVKAFRGMTHEIRDKTTKKFLDNKQVFEKFLSSLGPIITDKKLSCILLQFPFSFYPSEENRDYLKAAKDRLGDIPAVVEFRNSGWLTEATFRFLEEQELGYCAVDEPNLKGLMPFAPRATAAIGYFRLHGRNKNWFNAPVSERYNYLYSGEELRGFIPPIKEIAEKTGTVFVFFNNCHAGSAAKNAIMLTQMLFPEESRIGDGCPH
jgi:uncharacterized protein YecE (DUF72 family)